VATCNGEMLIGLPACGSYRLTIRLSRPARVAAGRLGRLDLPAGVYVYCGSARRNLPARVARHLRRRKAARWHVDYLLAHPAAKVTAVGGWGGRGECELVAEAIRGGGRAVAHGFGSSDCRRGCPAHLIFMGDGRPRAGGGEGATR
jgi:Uri superfamily endonuclease